MNKIITGSNIYQSRRERVGFLRKSLAESVDMIQLYHVLTPELLVAAVPKYSILYMRTQEEMMKLRPYNRRLEKDKRMEEVEKTIQRVIEQRGEENKFKTKFSVKRSRSVPIKRQGGMTEQEKQDEQLRMYFAVQENVVTISEKTLLREYYLKDEEKGKINIDYLRTAPTSNRHRRLTPKKSSAEKLFFKHDEHDYQSLKKRTLVREQFVEKCFHSARRNITYRRRKNFEQIEYIMLESNNNLAKLCVRKLNNRLWRVFLHFAYCSDSMRVYYDYIVKERFEEMEMLMMEIDVRIQRDKIVKEREEIMHYKQNKVLHFEDFRELVMRFGWDIEVWLDKLSTKRPELLMTANEMIMYLEDYIVRAIGNRLTNI